MRITLKTAISVAIFIALYTGFQGGRYYLANRVQEIGILCCLIMFVYGAVMTSLTVKDPDFRWSWWVFSTLFFLAYTFFLPAQRFSVNAGVPLVPSLFASREFLISLLCPSLYFLYRLGFEVERIEKIFLVSLVALVLAYTFHYYTMNLPAAYFSSDHAVAGLVTYDPWRGYRLKTPSFAFYLLSVLAPMFIFTQEGVVNRLKWLLMTFLLVHIWILVSHRSMALSLIASTLAYHFFFAKKVRLGLFFMILPAVFIIVPVGLTTAVEHLSQLDPETDGVRYKSGMLAWNQFLQTPLFGFGQQSNSTLTEQQIFWYKFYSADLGLIGIMFKYGGVGAVVYVFFSIYMIRRMILTNWAIKKEYGKINPTIFSLLIVFVAFTLNIILVPVFTYIPGITAGAFGIALTSIWQHKLGLKRSADKAKAAAAGL
jgi:hypothetical protein